MQNPNKEQLQRLAAEIRQKLTLAVEARDANPTTETESAVRELRAQQRKVSQQILTLEFGLESEGRN